MMVDRPYVSVWGPWAEVAGLLAVSDRLRTALSVDGETPT